MNKLLKNIIIVAGALVVSYFTSPFFGKLYDVIFPSITGSYIDFTALIGLPISYIFFLTLLFTVFGGTKKYWWIAIALIPAIIFEAAFDLQHIYFPVAIGLVGWLIGKGLSMLIAKHKL